MWQLRCPRGSYGVYVPKSWTFRKENHVYSSKRQVHPVTNCHVDSVTATSLPSPTSLRANHLSWHLWDGFTWMCDHCKSLKRQFYYHLIRQTIYCSREVHVQLFSVSCHYSLQINQVYKQKLWYLNNYDHYNFKNEVIAIRQSQCSLVRSSLVFLFCCM